MPRNVRNILLVRHGESLGNVDKDIHRTHADHATPLSRRGHGHALEAGRFIENFFKNVDLLAPSGRNPSRPRLWTSPYLRTRQTADGIEQGVGKVDGPCGAGSVSRILDRREHLALCEQQFGLFDGIPTEELPKRYPDEHAHYKKQEEFEGRFWARMPMGESRWDVAMRVHQAFGTWHRDADRHGVQDLIVVSHGVTVRCIVMRWLHLPFEWIEKERNPKNCSIRLIQSGVDKGYIFKGG